jgi:hypothetical protein
LLVWDGEGAIGRYRRRADAEHAADLVGANWAHFRLTGGLIIDDREEE